MEDGEESEEEALSIATQECRHFVSSEEWEERLHHEVVPKEYLNKLVMSYLIAEGLQDVAAHFERESGCVPTVDLTKVQARVDIRNAVVAGDIERAIRGMLDLDPGFLDDRPGLHFVLRRQQYVELIRRGLPLDALALAKKELVPLAESDAKAHPDTEQPPRPPHRVDGGGGGGGGMRSRRRWRLGPSAVGMAGVRRGEEDGHLLAYLEEAMLLLAFPGGAGETDAPSIPQAVAHLLDESQRHEIGARVNAEILAMQQPEKSENDEPNLGRVIQQMIQSQRELAPRVSFPMVDEQTLGMDLEE